jgi:hypothetical protein
MPSPAAVIGGSFTVYLPDDTEQIALGYTGIRIYVATSETAVAALATTLPLVAGTFDYSYNKTDANATDWFQWCLYGAAPGEGPRSQLVPIGPTRVTRLQVRQGVGKLMRVMDGPYAIATATDSDTIVISELIDPDASAHRFANRYLRVSAGTAIGQTRRSRAANASPAGYVPSTGTMNVNRATSPAWLASDSVEIWRAKGDEDTAALVDQAINDAATAICWEDTFYLTIDEGVSEYYLPSGVNELTALAVDWAQDSYPSKPDWRPIGYARFGVSGGNNMVTILRETLGTAYYSQGDIIRIRYAAFPDNMDSDTDYWAIPQPLAVALPWAVAEAAMAFLDSIGTPSGGLEQVIDAERAKASLRRKLDFYRSRCMPVATILTVLPR